MPFSNIQSALDTHDFTECSIEGESLALGQFHERVHRQRARYAAFVGGDGSAAADLSRGDRRRIMQVLRKACMVMGPGQKSRLGRLGAGAALGAIIAGFATPVSAQYQAGGGTAHDSQSTAVGSGAVAGQAGTQTLDTNGDTIPDLTLNQDTAVGANASATGGFATAIGNGVSATGLYGVAMGSGSTATGDQAIAIGRSNSVNSFNTTSTITNNGVFDRSAGGNFTFPVGGTQLAGYAVGIGSANTVTSGGVAIGASNQASHASNFTMALGLGNQTVGAYGAAIGVANAVSGTSAVAIGTANLASDNTSIAMGRQSSASGNTSIALGNVSTASQTNAIAIGHSTQATAEGAIALGGGTNGASTNLDATAARATGANAVAIGTNSNSADVDAVAIGRAASAANEGDIAFGAGAIANSDVNGINAGAVAIGMSSVANNSAGAGNNSVAIGRQAIATSTAAAGSSPTAIGAFANASGAGSQVAIGDSSTASGTDAIAIGGHAFAAGSLASGTRSTAIGQSVTAAGQSAIAIGDGSQASNTNSIAIGTGNNVSGANSGAIGDPNTITGSGSYALGNNNSIAANNAFAIGNNISIAAGRDGSVGIGDGTTVAAPNSGAFTLNGGTAAATAPTAVVSVGSAGGERQLTHVAAGVVSASSTDAINGSQLFTVATAANNLGNSLESVTGGGLVINVDGTIATAPSITAAGATHNNVTAAIQALNSANTTSNNGLASALGGGAAVAANGSVTAPSYVIGGNTYNDVGSALAAAASSGGFNLTTGATGSGSVSGTTVEAVGGGETVTIRAGDNVAVTQSGNTIDVALSSTLTGIDSIAITGGPKIDGNGIVLAAGDSFDAGGNILSNVGAGSLAAGSTQGVNGGQVNALGSSVASNLGGGSTFNPATGAVTAPTYSVAGGTQNDVGAAFAALNGANNAANSGLAAAIGGGAAVAANGAVTAPSVNVNGTNYSNLADAISAAGAGFNLTTAAAGSGVANGSSVVGVGAGETVTLTAGDNIVTTQSGNGVTVALNSDLTGLSSLTIIGGPSLSGSGIAMNGDGINGLAAGSTAAGSTDAINGGQLNTGLASVASNLGGGSVYDPLTGTVTAPTYTVQGSTYSNVGAALGAVDSNLGNVLNGTAGLVQQTGGAPGAGLITVGAATGGTHVSFAGTDGDRVLTDVTAGALTAGSTDAVNGGQINTLAASNASIIGGGASFNPLTGVFTAPIIMVGGTGYANVSDAIEAGDAKTDTLGASTAAGLGGGSVYDPATGTVSAPAYAVAGGNQSNAGAAFAALDNANNSANTGLAAALGGGAAVAADGTVTAPSYTVQGATHNNVGAALGAVDSNLTNLLNGSAGLVQQVGGAPGNGLMTVGAATGGTQMSFAGTDGDRVLSGVAAGNLAAGSTEAVNGSQLYALANALGAPVGPGGAVIPPAFVIEGSTYSNAGDAFAAIDSALSGGGIKYFRANSTLSDSTPLGIDSIAVGPVSGAGGDQAISVGLNAAATSLNAIAIGTGSTASGASSLAIGVGNLVSGDNSGAFGDPNVVTGSGSYAFGNDNSIDANNAFALGNNISIAAGLDGSVGIGNGATVSAPNFGAYSVNGGLIAGTAPVAVVSIGATGAERQMTNVAAGVVSASSTDAVNGSQLFAVGSALTAQGNGLAAALGGGAAVSPDGTVTAPSYTVQGSSYGNVGAALGAVDGNLTTLNGAVASLANGTSGLVQQAGGSPGNGAITVGAATGGTLINVAGTDGNRVVTGVADGAIAAGSSDAVNGGQLFAVQTVADGALQRSGGAMTGQIDMGGNRITNLGAPVAASDAATRGYVDGVAAAGTATTNALGQSVAANLGGGASYDPATGQVSAPSYVVGGVARGNVGDAIAATNRLGVQYVADASGNPTNAVRLTGNGNGQPVAVTNVAAGALNATSTDVVNGGQLYAVQQVAAGAVQYDRNPDGSLNFSSVSLGTPGTPVQVRNVAPAIRSTDAVNLGQMQSALVSNLSSANAYTDARISDLAFDLRDVAQKSYAGTAAAMALQSPALFDPGSVAMRGGAGFYRGEWALGLSVRATDDEGQWSISGGISGGPNAGVAASVGFDFILDD